MKVVEFPAPISEEFKIDLEFDSLRFEIQSARMIADRLRFRKAESRLASHAARENVENTLIHLGSLMSLLADIKEKMDSAGEPSVPEHIRRSWTQYQRSGE